MWGFSGGVAIFKPRVNNIIGNEFKEKPVYSIAPTTLNLSLDLKKRWNLEFGYGMMNLTNDRQFYPGNNRTYPYYGGEINAYTAVLRIKHKFSLAKNISIAPFAGLTHIQIEQPAGGRTRYVIDQCLNPEDSLGKNTLYRYNKFLAIELGIDLSVKMSPRLFICTNVSWLNNSNRWSYQGVHLPYFTKSLDD